MKSRKIIEEMLKDMKENTVIEACGLYKLVASEMTEVAFYKTLERLCKRGSLAHLTKGLYYIPKKSRYGFVPLKTDNIISYYIDNFGGLVIGYTLYNKKGLTTQISKKISVLSNRITGQRKTIQDVSIKSISCELNPKRISIIETLEILQHYSEIENIDNKALITYMEKFSKQYSDNDAIYVLKNMKYKKSTIAFLAEFLNYMNINNTLDSFLSSLSKYNYPSMEEIYEIA